MLLPIETSAPTYRKMAAAPNNAHGDARAVSTESCLAAGGGAVLTINRCERQMKMTSRTINPAINRNDVSMPRSEVSRIAAVCVLPASPEKTPPRSISQEPR